MEKKEAIKYIVDRIESLISVPILRINKKMGSVTFELKDDCKVFFSFDTVLAGSKGKNSFVLSFSMTLYNSLFAKIRREAFNKKDENVVTKDVVFVINYGGPFKSTGVNICERYFFSNNEDDLKVADLVVQDIQKYFIPYIEPFLIDYTKLLDLYRDPLLIKNMGNWYMFINGVIAALLTKQEDQIEALVLPLAKSNNSRTEFLEFKKAANYQTELVQPIKDYIICNVSNGLV